jgi:hypothetical protein
MHGGAQDLHGFIRYKYDAQTETLFPGSGFVLGQGPFLTADERGWGKAFVIRLSRRSPEPVEGAKEDIRHPELAQYPVDFYEIQ